METPDDIISIKNLHKLPRGWHQGAVFKIWANDFIIRRTTQMRERFQNLFGAEPQVDTLHDEERFSLFLMAQPHMPPNARRVSEQIFRWGIDAHQFIALQKSLDLELFLEWGMIGKPTEDDIYILEEEIHLVEERFPQLTAAANSHQAFIDALNLLWEGRSAYDWARCFWGFPPVEIMSMRPRIFRLYKYLCDVDEVTPKRVVTPLAEEEVSTQEGTGSTGDNPVQEEQPTAAPTPWDDLDPRQETSYKVLLAALLNHSGKYPWRENVGKAATVKWLARKLETLGCTMAEKTIGRCLDGLDDAIRKKGK